MGCCSTQLENNYCETHSLINAIAGKPGLQTNRKPGQRKGTCHLKGQDREIQFRSSLGYFPSLLI